MNRVINNIGINETPMFPRVKNLIQSHKAQIQDQSLFSVMALSFLPKGQWLLPVEREAIEK